MMVYEYPEVEATNPEETLPVPAKIYSCWAITRLVSTLGQRIEDGELVEDAKLLVQGQKYHVNGGILDPLENATSFRADDMFQLFNEFPAMGTAYNILVDTFVTSLDLVDNINRIVSETDPIKFAQGLVNLGAAYSTLGNVAKEAVVNTCITNYPDTWSREQCLAELSPLQFPPEVAALGAASTETVEPKE